LIGLVVTKKQDSFFFDQIIHRKSKLQAGPIRTNHHIVHNSKMPLLVAPKDNKQPLRSSSSKLIGALCFVLGLSAGLSVANIQKSSSSCWSEEEDWKNKHLSTKMDHVRNNNVRSLDIPGSGYDVLDIGSSKGGGSINFLPRAVSKLRFIENKTGQLLDARTLGLDYDPEKVKTCNEANAESRNDCLLFDILRDTPSDLQLEIIGTTKGSTTKNTNNNNIPVRTISGNSYWHVLEHIPDCGLAQQMWIKAAEFSKRFSSFHGPAFDNELSRAGEDPTGPHRFWENWSGHTCHFNSTMLKTAIKKVSKTRAYVVVNYGEINSTDHEIIVPEDTPFNSHHYDNETMSSKKGSSSRRIFDPPLYEEMRACAIYDQDGDRVSLYSALCLLDALQGPYRLRKHGGHLVRACAAQDRKFKSLEHCAQELKQKALQTIQYFERLPSDKVLQSI